MQRRTFFGLGLASGAVLLVAGGAAAVLQPGLERGKLSPVGRGVFAAVGRAVLDKTLPADRGLRDAAISGLLERIDALTASLPPHAQGELSQLLSLLGSAAGRHALATLAVPWRLARVVDVQRALQGMRLSRFALKQQAYSALHEITSAAYFSDSAMWPILGYPGPRKIGLKP